MAERNTIQQAIIAHELEALGNHPTADEVYQAIHVDYPSIGKATVYRTLNRMVDNGSAIKVPVRDGADRFDHRTYPHHHIHCSVCGRVDDVVYSLSQDMVDSVSSKSGYVVEPQALDFEGICPACQTA